MDLERPVAPHPYDLLPAAPSLAVSSTDFADGSPLPESAASAAGNVSPQLSWAPGPEGTRAYFVTCFDPDAPVAGGFLHWALVVPGSVTSLTAGSDAPQGSVVLTNGYGEQGFDGAAPPEGDRPHRYFFAVTALSTDDHGIESDTPFAKAQFMNLGTVLARGWTMGTYQL